MQPISRQGSSVECTVVPSPTHFKFSEETARLIEHGWEEVISRRPSHFKNGQLFDKPLLRVESAMQIEDHLHIKLIEDISYKDVVGLRANDFANKISPSDAFKVASLILIIETAEGAIVLRERDSGDWEHSFELPGGFITSNKLRTVNGNIEQLARFIAKSELGIGKESIDSFQYMGPLAFAEICEYMQIFRIKLSPGFELPHTPGVIAVSSQHPLTDKLMLPLHYPSKRVLELASSYIAEPLQYTL